MSLQQYWDELEKHDWYYPYSDDNRTFNRGSLNEKRLKREAFKNTDMIEMYEAFGKYHFSGPAYNTERAPKPERPGGPKHVDETKNNIPF